MKKATQNAFNPNAPTHIKIGGRPASINDIKRCLFDHTKTNKYQNKYHESLQVVINGNIASPEDILRLVDDLILGKNRIQSVISPIGDIIISTKF